ncbi:HNH endonuclease [Gordonia phage Malibo]|nr:HNH endonuclease [Gordonia phage Malibo]
MSRPTKSAHQRGLGYQHRKTRERLLNRHRDGTPCWWCGQPMYTNPDDNFDGKPLEADHTRSRAHHGTRGNHADRLLHHTCNRQRGNGDRDDQRPTLAGTSTAPSAPTDDLRIMRWPW